MRAQPSSSRSGSDPRRATSHAATPGSPPDGGSVVERPPHPAAPAPKSSLLRDVAHVRPAHEPTGATILVIEDSDEDFEVLGWAFRQANTPPVSLRRCLTGEAAFQYLERRGGDDGPTAGPLPGIIMLDLNLPGTDGREILIGLRKHDIARAIPVIIVTTSTNPRDVELCYRSGASGYLVKTSDPARFVEMIQAMHRYWFETVMLPE